MLVFASPICLSQTTAWQPALERAVSAWRQGEVAAALSQLRALRLAHPTELAIANDLVVVAHGARETALALEVGRTLTLGTTPSYVLRALGNAARAERAFALSRECFELLHARDPKEVDAVVGLALALRGEQKYAQARQALDAAGEHAGMPRALALSVLEARALIDESDGRFAQALEGCEAMLALQPDARLALLMRFRVLRAIGLPHVAQARTPAEILSADERQQLRHELMTRESRFRYVTPAESPADIRFRLDPIVDALRLERSNAVQATLALRMAFDEVALLSESQRPVEALTALEPLLQAGTPLPAWFAAIAGEVLLSNRRPREAIVQYQAALAGGLGDIGTKLGLFYALLEFERTDDALSLARTMVQDAQKPVDGVVDKAALLDARILLVRALLYTDQTPLAYEALLPLYADVPANREVNFARIEVLAARGWLGEAESALQWLRGEIPDHPWVLATLADVRAQRGNRGGARTVLEEVRVIAPENRRGLRVARDQATAHSGLVRLELGAGRSDALETGALAGRERRAELNVYSPWLFDRTRAWGRTFVTSDESKAGVLIRRTGGALGADWSAEDLAASVLIGQDNAQRLTASLRGTITFDDRLKMSLSASRNETDLPLRGWAQAVQSTSAQVGAEWRWHESRSLGASVGTTQFSDQNRRFELSTYWTEVWQRTAHFTLDTRVDGYALSNSKQNVAYFAPRERYGGSLTGSMQWMQWRAYEYNMSHHLVAALGIDTQSGYERSLLASVRYEHLWRLGACTDLRYGVQWLRRNYDGVSERKSGVFLSLERRLL